MYNKELKERFIQSYTKSDNSANKCKVIFDHFETFENKWGADLCTRTAEDLQPAVDSIIGVRFKSQITQLIVIQKYIKWCVRNNIPGAIDDTKNIKEPGVEKIKTQTVANPQQLQDFLNIVYDKEEENTTDNIYRAFYWLAYSGIPETYIMDITADDVDFMNMRITHKDVEVRIYGESIPCLMRCVNSTQFTYKHPNYTTVRDRLSGNTIVRGVRGKSSIHNMRTIISNRAKEKMEKGLIDKNLSYYRVWMSGLFYRVYQDELRGIFPDFSFIVAKFVENRTYNLDKGRNTQDAKKRQLIQDYHRDYERWKFAHEL